MAEYGKPIPIPDELTAPFWEAAKDHTLAIQRCVACGFYNHPPVVFCPRCNAREPDFRFEPVSGRGTIRSWVVVRDSLVKGFEDRVPWVNVLVELEEQPDLFFFASLLDGAEASLRLGAPVEVVYQDITPEVTLPQIRLVTT